MMLSTRNLSLMPGITQLQRHTRSLAMLEAIICPEWEFRYYSFDAHWSESQTMASMRNGEGDSYFLVFSPAGAILKGFDHESAMSPYASDPPAMWPGVLDQVPAQFDFFIQEPAFTISDTTYCIWRTPSDTTWQSGHIHFPDAEDPDGSATQLAILDDNPKTYQQWAEEYYERPFDLAAITHVYNHQPLTEEVVELLNDDLSLSELTEDIQEIGYGAPEADNYL